MKKKTNWSKVKKEWEREENQAIVYKRSYVASVAIFPPTDVRSFVVVLLSIDPNGRRLGEIRLRENFQKAAKIKDTTCVYHTWKKGVVTYC